LFRPCRAPYIHGVLFSRGVAPGCHVAAFQALRIRHGRHPRLPKTRVGDAELVVEGAVRDYALAAGAGGGKNSSLIILFLFLQGRLDQSALLLYLDPQFLFAGQEL
jgi:hypothetical protein